jgi:signal peptidase I
MPYRPARWAAAVAQPLAAAYLAALAAALLWTAGPAVLGWKPRVVLTGSMLPALRPGDVVLVAEAAPGPDSLPPGSIALVRDADRASGSYLHRVDHYEKLAVFVTKGDANPTPDNPPVDAGRLLGRARLVVPRIGLPALWVQQGRFPPLAAFLALTALAVLAASGLKTPHETTDRQLRGSPAATDVLPRA